MWSCLHVMPEAATVKRDKANISGIAEQKDGNDDIIEPQKATFLLVITDAYCLSHFYLNNLFCTLRYPNLKKH